VNEHRRNALMMNALLPRSSVELYMTEKKERLLGFAMVHQGVFFRSTKAAQKVMVDHQMQKERAENR